MNIIRGKIKTGQKVVIAGTEGIGKTTLASQCPDPLFIDTEGGTKQFDVARFEKAEAWPLLLAQVKYVYDRVIIHWAFSYPLQRTFLSCLCLLYAAGQVTKAFFWVLWRTGQGHQQMLWQFFCRLC